MRKIFISVFSIITLIAFGAQASPLNNVILLASPADTTTKSYLGKFTYLKKFQIALANVSETAIDLRNACYLLIGNNGQTYHVDTMEDTVSGGKLEPGKSVNGFVVFAGADEDIFLQSKVIIANPCE
ncbi:DUF4354 family protein [Chelatococcus asaccharovorans]|uniref:Uncharacterized protein DUF4354 n=1 Tax=Chelatococcus asaccharovorans TaxID=28210 RepID=A0A2V3U6U9_9HYPH|nr:DUF4354 family protein [Chelatococcus asaccharovorans]PXW58953.1 uncharacterized protein DUF4354 [Chelatococcus asaccharovorans]